MANMLRRNEKLIRTKLLQYLAPAKKKVFTAVLIGSLIVSGCGKNAGNASPDVDTKEDISVESTKSEGVTTGGIPG